MVKKIPELRKKIAFFCVGDSEKEYIEKVVKKYYQKKSSFSISPPKLAKKGASPLDMVNKVLKNSDYKDYAKVFIIFDKDKFPDFKQAIDTINTSKKFRAIYSAYSFEVWYLLHFNNNLKNYTSQKDELKALEKAATNYIKGDIPTIAKNPQNIKTAITNSKSIIAQHQKNQVAGLYQFTVDTPYQTMVYKIFEELDAL